MCGQVSAELSLKGHAKTIAQVWYYSLNFKYLFQGLHKLSKYPDYSNIPVFRWVIPTCISSKVTPGSSVSWPREVPSHLEVWSVTRLRTLWVHPNHSQCLQKDTQFVLFFPFWCPCTQNGTLSMVPGSPLSSLISPYFAFFTHLLLLGPHPGRSKPRALIPASSWETGLLPPLILTAHSRLSLGPSEKQWIPNYHSLHAGRCPIIFHSYLLLTATV